MTVNEALAHAAGHLATAAWYEPEAWERDVETTGEWEAFRAHADAAWAWAVVAIDLHRQPIADQWRVQPVGPLEGYWEM